MRSLRRTPLLVLALVTLVAACDAIAVPPPTGQVAPPVAPPVPVVKPTPDIAGDIEFRKRMGMRADEAFVRALAEDPAAVERGDLFAGHPLTEAEARDLEARVADHDSVQGPVTETWGPAHPDEYAGHYVDQARNEVVVLVTGRADELEQDLREFLVPGARFRMRVVRYSLAELQAIADRITRDREWLASHDSKVKGLGVDIIRNVVEAQFTGGPPGFEAMLAARYAAGERLLIDVYRPKPWTKGYGRVVAQAIFTDGRRTEPDIVCFIDAVEFGGRLGETDAILDDDGRCIWEEVGATIRVEVTMTLTVDGDRVVVGRGAGVVPRDGELFLRLTIAAGAN